MIQKELHKKPTKWLREEISADDTIQKKKSDQC